LSLIAKYNETVEIFSAGLISELKIFISSLIIGGTQYLEFLYNLKGNSTNLFISLVLIAFLT
jgi:hypothetical protein